MGRYIPTPEFHSSVLVSAGIHGSRYNERQYFDLCSLIQHLVVSNGIVGRFERRKQFQLHIRPTTTTTQHVICADTRDLNIPFRRQKKML